MRRLFVVTAVAACAALAACDDAAYRAGDDDIGLEPTIETPPIHADEVGAPVAEVAPPAPAPVDTSALPPDQRSSEESVQPESETLFY